VRSINESPRLENKKLSKLVKSEQTETALVVDINDEFAAEAGLGTEATKDDLSIPFLNLLQSLSPQVQESNPDGARAGMFYNTNTRALYTRPVVVPVHKERCFIEWVPRKEGGGFVAKYDVNDPVVVNALRENKGSRIHLKLGENDLVETVNWAVLLLDPTGNEVEGFAVLGFTSTKLKPEKDWYTQMITTKDASKRPIFCYRSVLTSFLDKRKLGTNYNIRVEPFNGVWYDPSRQKADSLVLPSKHPNIYAAAKELREMFKSGAAEVDYNQSRGHDGNTGDDEVAPF